MNSKKISQLSLSPNACYVQFKIPSQAELLLSISKGFWIFFVKSNQFISRKIPWTFVKFRCYYYYLQVLEMCRVVCFNIMVEKFKLPAVGYLPWPLPTSNFKKIQNSKICTHKIEKIRETATTTIFYPPLVWLSLSRARVNSSVISSSRVVTCITRSSSFILGLRRLAAEEGTFSKKTWLQKI